MKFNKYVDRNGLASFFRQLADALEQGGTGELECVDEFTKMKIGVKDEYGQLTLKVKVKVPDTCVPSEEGGDADTPARPKYKDLKKRMKASFRVLVKMIHDGQTPPAQAVEEFLADSALMVSYPGYGDEYYERYTEACEAFKAAYESGDAERMHKAIDVLVHEKSRCHAKYD